jgi:hypothetical protein
MDKYIPGISVVAGLLMLKWDLLNYHLDNHSLKINYMDKEVDIFINFESILYNLSMYKNLNTLLNTYKKEVVLELESGILNLIANYNMYFKKRGLIPYIYLYHTSLSGEEQEASIYNKYYRSYYHNRFSQNPQYKQLGEILNNIIIPELKLIISYIPRVYFIESKRFDGSIIPMIVSSRKSVIVTEDVFDTLYLFNPNFVTLYIKRRYKNFNLISDVSSAVQSIIKDENPMDLSIFNSELYYRLLLSVRGSKIRNIKSAMGFGYSKFIKIIKDGLDKGIVLHNFESIDSIIELFPIKYRDDIKLAFQLTDLDLQFNLLNSVDIEESKSQITDRIDITSLEMLNNKRFFEFPINLQGLLE